ncbi:hypothetical protein, conserved [Leishmania tarentolae]|uniref:Uncharacterized protein n=1 Tax=Leishmania tarentolae TaxID=5689 RepID=A0A640KDM4_LEITA|nr:hypothetical protein, conserved [Leishmania tarentolae]
MIMEREPSRPEARSMGSKSPANQAHGESPMVPQLAKVMAPGYESSFEEAAYPKGNETRSRDPCKQSDVSAGGYTKDRNSDNEKTAEEAHAGAVSADVAKTRPNDLHKTQKKSSNPMKESKAAEPVEKPAAPRKKKPAYKVNIRNVGRHPPVPEGVNTPRSVALCKEHGVNPSELAPYDRKHFKGAGVSDEVAELRYQSYEKRRCARMAQLAPAYKEMIKNDSERSVAASAAKRKTPAADDVSAQPCAAEQSATPPQQPLDEDTEMQRQFEAQHQRLLEQERRKMGSGYDSDGRRRSPPRGGYAYGASGRSVGSARSPGRYSRNTSIGARTAADQPYSATKIYSASILENRPLTEREVIMIDEINEREARRIDTQERAFVMQENKELMHIERELMRERLACVRVQKTAEDREKMQQKMHERNEARQAVAAERRKKLEAEREARIQGSIAEREVHARGTSPYTPLLSH